METEKQRQMDRQIDRQTDRQTDRYIARQIGKNLEEIGKIQSELERFRDKMKALEKI